MSSNSKSGAAAGVGALLAGRFAIRLELGAGAFGVVYEADDLVHGEPVALKRLTQVSGASIYRFKKEFRALADREHPNLVRFREFFHEGEEWFFSMELIRGEHFDRHVLGPRFSPLDLPTAPDSPTRARAINPSVAPDLAKLRPALAQLVAGVRELHAFGVVHRDLKPSNVLVDAAGRVVVLDFGLATENEPDAQKSGLGMSLGTPTYMSPEQTLGRQVTEATDWYAMGVMLFEVLHGRAPFSGTVHDLLTAKLSPSTWPWPTPPEGARDLDELCRALVHPDPLARPSGEEIARRLNARAFVTTAPSPKVVAGPAFFGRARELRALSEAFRAVDLSGPVVVRIHGQSGMGKSALVKNFVQSLGPDTVTLAGRCYLRESVPYKTLDGVVDALTRYLGRLSAAEANVLMPREAGALGRLFPVFGRLRLLADQPGRQRSGSPHEERRRGFAALREVLARIGDRKRLVVTIDDVQWGDPDSLEPLTELLAPPDPPRLLLLLSYRSGVGASRPIPSFGTAVAGVRDLEVGPLEGADTVALVESLLPESERGRAQSLADESGGIPFFVAELARAQDQTPGAPAISLEEAMQRRAAQLSRGALRLLEVVAVAGRPVSRGMALSASGLDEEERKGAAQELVRERFLRSSTADDGTLEVFHDRVRESVVLAMSAERLRLTHEAVAAALVASDSTDAEALAEHYRLAGRLTEARAAAITAAERAVESYAFERAITLYRVAQDGSLSFERRLLTAKLADVLSYAGRGKEAAAAYLDAVEGATPHEQREFRRRAAEQLLRCGAVEEGTLLVRQLLADADLSYPVSRAAVLASVAKQRLLLAVRGVSYARRALGPADDEAVSRVDLCWTVGACLSPIDLLRGADFQTRHLRQALALGDPYRVARGLAIMAITFAAEGGSALAKGEKLALLAERIAREIDHPHAIGWSLSALGSVRWSTANWRASLKLSREASEVFRKRSPESVWEAALPEIMLSSRSMFSLGELEAFRTETESWTRAAEERGDQLTVTLAKSVAQTKVHLLDDQPGRAREASAEGISRWAKSEWHLQHQEDFRAQLQCDLYEGDGQRALARIAANWQSLDTSMLLRAQTERIQSYTLFASAGLCAGDVKAASRWLRLLARDDNPWAKPHVQAIRAGLLALEGSAKAPGSYEQAAADFEALEMPLYAAAARRRRGQLLGGSAGAQLLQTVDAFLSAQGVSAPARLAATLVQ